MNVHRLICWSFCAASFLFLDVVVVVSAGDVFDSPPQPTSTLQTGVRQFDDESSPSSSPSLTSGPSSTTTPSTVPTVTDRPTSTIEPTTPGGDNETMSNSTDELGIQTPPDGSDCWGNLTDILMDQRQYSFRETTVKRTYIVCPNKLYRTGTTDQNDVFDPNFHAIFGMRRNVEYRCGADGSSANNCTIRGLESLGQLVMVGVPDVFVTSCTQSNDPRDGVCDIIVDNFTFRGFTLEETAISLIFGIGQVGENVLFDDLIVQNAAGHRHIYISKFGGLVEERRHLADGNNWIPPEFADRWPWNFRMSSDSVLQNLRDEESSSVRHHDDRRRQLQAEEEDFSLIDFDKAIFNLTITNSKFIGNSIRQCPRFVSCVEDNPNFNFLVSADKLYSPINLINCTFQNNDFSSPVNPKPQGFYGLSHLVALDLDSIMTDNVFINNTVTSSLIRVFDNTSDQDLVFANNYVDPSPVEDEFDADGIDCTFALVGGITDLDAATCVEADITEEEITTPPPSASTTPDDQPTLSPSTGGGGTLITPSATIRPMSSLPTDAPSASPTTSDGGTPRGILSHHHHLFYLTLLGSFIMMLKNIV